MNYKIFIGCVLLSIFSTIQLHAQNSQLSIQGVLRKAEGNAVENGTYDITFKLYTQPKSKPQPKH
ncbi:MAG: hypothetical protein AAFO94_08840 [Bacteroidota bacterium]